MMKVNIRETLERVVDVESIEDAESRYRDSEIILDSDDLIEVEFSEYKGYPQLDLHRAKELIRIMIDDFQIGHIGGGLLPDEDVINYLFALDFTEEELMELGFSEDAIDSANSTQE